MNLWHRCSDCFGQGGAHIDLLAAEFLDGRQLEGIRFYCGMDNPRERPKRHATRTRRNAHLKSKGIHVWTQTMKYANRAIVLDDHPLCLCGRKKTKVIREAREKGVDLRIGLDMLRMARHNEYDVALLVTMDTDMKQVVDELRRLSQELRRHISVENVVIWNEGNLEYPRVRGCTRYHVIDQDVFHRIQDLTDYSIPHNPPQARTVQAS